MTQARWRTAAALAARVLLEGLAQAKEPRVKGGEFVQVTGLEQRTQR